VAGHVVYYSLNGRHESHQMAAHAWFIARGMSALLPELRCIWMAIETQLVGVLGFQRETRKLVTIHAIDPFVCMFTIEPLAVCREMRIAVTSTAVLWRDWLTHCESCTVAHLTRDPLRRVPFLWKHTDRCMTLETSIWLTLSYPRLLEHWIVEGVCVGGCLPLTELRLMAYTTRNLSLHDQFLQV
jgi:hypothetical protein